MILKRLFSSQRVLPIQIMPIFYSNCYTAHLPANHRFPMERYAKTNVLVTHLFQGFSATSDANPFQHNHVQEDINSQFPLNQTCPIPHESVQLDVVDATLITDRTPLFECGRIIAPPLANVDNCALAHDREFVESYLQGTLTEEHKKQVGFDWSYSFAHRTLAITGGTLHGSRHVTKELRTIRNGRWIGAGGIACNMAGGTHHAFRDRGEGFCIYNDLAIAAVDYISSYEQRAQKLELALPKSPKVLIVDLDVHQGNGTASIFSRPPFLGKVITASVHGGRNYPWASRYPSTVDIDLPDECDDDTYNAAVERLFEIVDGLRYVSAGKFLEIHLYNEWFTMHANLGQEVIPPLYEVLLEMKRNNVPFPSPTNLPSSLEPYFSRLFPHLTEDQTKRIPTRDFDRHSFEDSYLQHAMDLPRSSQGKKFDFTQEERDLLLRASWKRTQKIAATAKSAIESDTQGQGGSVTDTDEILLLQMGVDALKEDRLGRLHVTRTGLIQRNDYAFRWAENRNLPTMVTMGGGYSRPIEYSVRAHADVFMAAARSWRRRAMKYVQEINDINKELSLNKQRFREIGLQAGV